MCTWLCRELIMNILNNCSYFENNQAIPIYSDDAPSYFVECALRMIFSVPRSKVCTEQPIGVTHTATFLVDSTNLRHRDDIRCDDLGVWKNVGVRSKYCSVHFDENNNIKDISKMTCKPSVMRSSIYRVKRSYWCHAEDNQFFRRLIEVEGIWNKLYCYTYVQCIYLK